MLVLSNSLRGSELGYQVSYVLSKAEGNVDNTGFGDWHRRDARGRSPNNRRH